MLKILVASENPVKILATKDAFSKYFDRLEVVGVKAPSGVEPQPINEKVFQGAFNRTMFLKKISGEQKTSADFFVGIEEGMAKKNGLWFVEGWVSILDAENKMHFGTTSSFMLPEKIVENLLAGVELGVEVDKLIGEVNSKQKNGAIGYFSHGLITRKDMHVQAILMALIPFINKNLYRK
jgi:inosine/xanthosine triphosphatase